MNKLFLIIFVCLVASCAPVNSGTSTSDTGTLRIVEVLPNPVGEDKYNEAITLENTSKQSLSLTGWQFRSKGIGMPFAVSTTASSIAAGTRWRTTTFPYDRAWLNNDGDSLYLINPQGAVVQSVGWGRVGDGEVVRP